MQLDDSQAALLKPWVVKKLEDISDDDSDVLADYVLALLRADDDPAKIRQNSIDNLKDFLLGNTEGFVNEIIKAVQTRSYDPDAPKPQPQQYGSRKRTFDDRHDDEAPTDRYHSISDRPIKQSRRGRGGRGQQAAPQWQMPEGMPPLSMQDAMSMMAAMHQAMGLPPIPGMQGLQAPSRGKRCRDYDNKGFCTRGASCKFEHGTDAIVVGEGRISATRGGRGRGGGARGGHRRAEFSAVGSSDDKSLTAIVVESIPEDKLNEQSVRETFEEFGTITAVDVQAQRRLAIVTYSTWDEANAAWKSPKVLFDNRFVKVFWYKPNSSAGDNDTEMGNDEPQIDLEEVARRQEEAQRKHEENKKLREAAQQQRSDIDAKLKAMEDERKRYAELLAKKTGTTSVDTTGESEQTRGLKEQLAKLEAEALSLGIDPTSTPDSWQGTQPWRGRGGFRGRGRYPTRASFRGSWNANGRGGAVKRLDNRPRTLAVTFPDGTYEKYGEAMQQYLLFSGNLEHASLSRHPDRADAAMVAFEERYRAENFMTAAKGPSGIPNIGVVEISWMANPTPPSVEATPTEVTMSDIQATNYATTDAEYDVAEA